jgi:murein endopeptidase
MNIQKMVKRISVSYLILIMIGCSSDYKPEEPPADANPYWDTDGDGISNAVEINPANAHHGFDTTQVDANPSKAKGQPNSGSLEGGINLPDEGEGYYHYIGRDPVDRDDWGTLALINMIEGGGRWWQDLGHYSPRIGIGDMSLKEGGPFTNYYDPTELDHESHQNGLDVDVRYVRKDNLESPLNIKDNAENYDTSRTVIMLSCLWTSSIEDTLCSPIVWIAISSHAVLEIDTTDTLPPGVE